MAPAASSWCRGSALPVIEQTNASRGIRMMNIAVRTHDRFIAVDGLDIRYLEVGNGVPAILLHGSSLGSSADVFRRNLPALASGGVRAIAVDLPGFGKSDPAT